MKDDRALKLFEEILEGTNSKKLPWKRTAEAGVFIVPLKGKYVLKAYPHTDIADDGTRIGPPSFTLFEGDNVLIIDLTGTIEGIAEEQLKRLYATVKRQALGVDEKIDEVISELKKLST